MRSSPMASLTSLTHGAQLGGLAVDRGLGGAQEVGDRDAGDLDGVLHREEEAGAGALVDLHREHVLAVEGDRAGGDGVLGVTRERVGQRGLAGAVGAHDRVRLAGRGSSGRRRAGSPWCPPSASTETWRSLDLKGGHGAKCSCSESVLGRRRRGRRRRCGDGVDGDGDDGRRAGGLARAEVEARAVQPALEGAAVELALGRGETSAWVQVSSTRARRRRSVRTIGTPARPSISASGGAHGRRARRAGRPARSRCR